MSIRFTSKRQNRGELCVMSCDSGKPLALRILKHLNGILKKEDKDIELKLVDSDEITFANGEIKTVINENIRGADLYIIQSIDDPDSEKSINDNLMALITAINASYQSDADSITVVVPQYPYSRQERKKNARGNNRQTSIIIFRNLWSRTCYHT